MIITLKKANFGGENIGKTSSFSVFYNAGTRTTNYGVGNDFTTQEVVYGDGAGANLVETGKIYCQTNWESLLP